MSLGLQEVDQSIGLYVAITAVTSIPPILRFYVLRKRRRNLASLISDICIALTVIVIIASHIYDIISAMDERKLWETETNQLIVMIKLVTPTWLKYQLLKSLLHITEIWLVKGAFLALYWNLFPHDGSRFSRLLRYTLHATAVTLVGTWISLMVIFFTYCPNLSDNWDQTPFLTSSFCSPYWGVTPETVWIVMTVSTDFMIFVIPLLVLNTVKMSRIEKRVLPLIFLMGTVPFIAPIIRYNISRSLGHFSGDRHNPHYEGIITLPQFHIVVILSYLETMGALLAFSVPSFRFMLQARYWTGKKKKLMSANFFSSTDQPAYARRQRKTLTQLAMESTFVRTIQIDDEAKMPNTFQVSTNDSETQRFIVNQPYLQRPIESYQMESRNNREPENNV